MSSAVSVQEQRVYDPITMSWIAMTQPLVNAGTVNVAGPISVSGSTVITQAASYFSQTIFTAPGNSSIVDATAAPPQWFAFQVAGTGAGASIWTAYIDGSLDGVNFTQVLAHITSTGNGVVVTLGGSPFPSRYFRTRVGTLTLGSATNIVLNVLANN